MSHHHAHADPGEFDENAAERLKWNDAMLLGHGPTDHAHQEFVHVVKALAACNAVTALGCLQAVEAHLLSHFESERQWMVQTDYPNMDCHLDEHQKVLDTVLEVNRLAKAGQVGLRDVRRLAAALADWFPKHATYLDSALSAWITKRRHGGAPVILRRDIRTGVQQESIFA
ncbi:bacteriohemerythrin [Massilia orientalis]|uniref:Bacteriohemerythrin n=1 Tax=Massilia orientalis TaxID=3050128 RepID=A0ACC7MDS6_9BURK|nr:hemerythrin domain-containing protein [Massilia sp. YIM B02787]